MKCFIGMKGVDGRTTLGTMVARTRLSEKRVSEPWLSRISLPAGGEESVGQMTIVSCGVRTVSDVQIQHCYSTVWREVERFRKILGKVTFEKGTDIVNRC